MTADVVECAEALPLFDTLVATNLLTNPSMETSGTTTTARTNLVTSPRAVNSTGVLAGGWTYSAGDEVGTTSLVTAATDGPLLSDGSRIATYARRSVTTAKTTGSTGWQIGGTTAIPTTIAAGDQYTASAWVRSSADVSINFRIQGRTGTTSVGNTDLGNVALKAGVWTLLSVTIASTSVITGAGDNILIWPYQTTGVTQPAGSTLDITGLIVEKAPVVRPYFDGAMTLVPTLRVNWRTNPAAASATNWAYQNGTSEVSTGVVVTGAVDGPVAGVTSWWKRTITTAKTTGSSGWYTRNNTVAVMSGAAGDTVTASMYLRASVDTKAVMNITPRLAGATSGTTQSGPSFDLPANTWVRVWHTFTPTAAYDDIQAWAAQVTGVTIPAGATIEGAAPLVEQTATLGAYFDGGTAATGLARYGWSGVAHSSFPAAADPDYTGATWSGTANASTSLLRCVRPAQATESTGLVLWSGMSPTVGARSLRFIPRESTTTGVATNSTFAYIGGTSTTAMNNGLVAGHTYTFQAKLRLLAAMTGSINGNARKVSMQYNTVSGTTGATTLYGTAAPNAAGDTVVSITVTLPVDAVWARCLVYNGSSALTPTDTFWDEFILVDSTDTGWDRRYFDGDTPTEVLESRPGWERVNEYVWTGTAHASTSQWRYQARAVPPVVVPPPDYPGGLRPVQAVPDPLVTHRAARFVYELQSRTGASKGLLDGVAVSGTLEYQYDARLKVGGKITVWDTGQVVDWLNDRIKISAVVGDLTWDLGVFLPTAPVERWAGGHRGWDVELHSKLLVLDQDCVSAAYSLDAGTVVTTAVRTVITSAGESAGSITDGTATLAAPMAWEAGTPKLSIVNDLLDAAGYFVLQVDGTGAYRAYPYVVPSQRPIRYTLADGATAIYLDAFERDQDIFSVPNRVIAIQQGTGGVEGLVSTADNTDPTSPFSIANRGRVIAAVFTGVEATDQAALDTYARRQLVDASAPSAYVQISHGLVPLAPYDAVQFTYSLGSLNARHVVDKTTVNLDPTALATTTLRQVVTYG